MRVLITGANGFIGKTLAVRLVDDCGWKAAPFTRADDPDRLPDLLADADAVVHLAGENRPQDPADFMAVNGDLTALLCDAIRSAGRLVPLIYTSSTQAERDNLYGESKRAGEAAVAALADQPGQSCTIFRLPNVFGKWARPDYNSAVATFCHNVARDLPIRIDDPAAPLTLVYIDDVVDALIGTLRESEPGLSWPKVDPEYRTTVGEVADAIRSFRVSRETLTTAKVGTGLIRALYATYVSALPPEDFSYAVPAHGDERGVFVEMLKTEDSGQFSFFTAHPGVTRGRHYHHSKTEKFLVIKGRARFGFRHIVSDAFHSLETSGERPEIVETVPGWSHDIANIGDGELIVMLWANEVFDRERPDTIARSVWS